MPQVDFVTFMEIINFFCFSLFLGFLFLNLHFTTLLNSYKEDNALIEQIKFFELLEKNDLLFSFRIEKNFLLNNIS